MDIQSLLINKIKNKEATGPYLIKYDSEIDIEQFANLIKKEISGTLDHPDFLEIHKNKDDKEYKVESKEIESFFKFLQYNPIKLHYKIIFFYDANFISTILSNKLLKTLEESNSQCLILLFSESKKDLLLTVESRCIKLQIKNISRNSKNIQDLSTPYDVAKEDLEEANLVAAKLNSFITKKNKTSIDYEHSVEILRHLREYSENQVFNNSKLPRITPFFD